VITGQQIRAVLGAGGHVVDSAGRHVGRIVDVVLGAGTGQPAWMSVDRARGTGVVVVPLSGAHRLDGCVQVPYSAEDIHRAPSADGATGRLDLRRAEELGRYFDSLDGHGGNGHRHTGTAPLQLVPLLLGLDVRTGRHAPAAYPATTSWHWPALSASSPGPPWWRRRQWRRPSVPTSVREMRQELRPVLDMTGLPADDLDDLVLAASEAAANAVERARLSTEPYFDVLTEVGEGRAAVMVEDHGRWRAPVPGGDRNHGLYLIGVLAEATLTVGARGTTVVLRSRPAPSG
jgi:anti-sigma regulatory factor (Ser/Thr protein kinase)